jgi:cytoskeleton protein RodZ
MSELGACLREARERQGISLAQASVDTRIVQQSLTALEDGAFQCLPSDVVVRGFIRNYAHYLGLETDELIELYRRERGATNPISIVPVTRPPFRRAYVFPSFFGIFFVTVALIGVSYIALNAVGRLGDRVNPTPIAAAAATIPPPSPLPTTAPSPAATDNPGSSSPGLVAPSPTVLSELTPLTPTAAVAGGAAATPGPTATASAPIVLELALPNARGNESSWVRVQTDNRIAFEGILRAGETVTFSAQRRVLVRAGNPPDVLVTVNGLQQGPLGPNPGQPVNWSWPPN